MGRDRKSLWYPGSKGFDRGRTRRTVAASAAWHKACLPPSDNNIAEHLFLLGAKAQGAFTTDPYPTARERMTAFMTGTVGVKKDDFRIYDGSGMSRHNLVTVRGIAQLLAWQNRQPRVQPRKISTL